MCNNCSGKEFKGEINTTEDLMKYKEFLEKELEVVVKTLKDIKVEAEK